MRLSTLPQAISLAVASYASTTAALATYTPSSGGPSYAVGIPSTSQISSSSTGSLYFQISAPSTYQWVGLGIGTQMAGATIFVMYADGNGNVTVGVRDGKGHVQPQLDTAKQTGITVLEGSGVANGMMVANVKCTTCELDSSSTSTSSPWIGAWYIGSALSSTSASASINMHEPENRAQFTFDLTAASLSSDSNPFVAATTVGGATSSASAGTAAPTSTSGSGSSTETGGGTDPSTKYSIAHGTIMGIAVVLIFPLASIYMRLGGGAWIHGAVQLLGLALLIAGLGTGVKLAQITQQLYEGGSRARTHTIFGTTLVALFLIQPFLGLYHHHQYQRTNSRNPVSHAHIWYGRALMIMAIVNGGLGLQLAANTTKGEIAYGVLAGVVGLAYIVLVIVKRKGSGAGFGRRGPGEKNHLPSEEVSPIATAQHGSYR